LTVITTIFLPEFQAPEGTPVMNDARIQLFSPSASSQAVQPGAALKTALGAISHGGMDWEYFRAFWSRTRFGKWMPLKWVLVNIRDSDQQCRNNNAGVKNLKCLQDVHSVLSQCVASAFQSRQCSWAVWCGGPRQYVPGTVAEGGLKKDRWRSAGGLASLPARRAQPFRTAVRQF